ncbi:hypothetical protein [Brachybacterium sp. UMB0905]|uniref:hypothetical protein n=1 Tax=Brachybacterium sp. UMB0905 TaxID=2069310 RepID=UPI0011AF4C42|nr:hypothetical protein [Brachybacterium sp. UMB0905]
MRTEDQADPLEVAEQITAVLEALEPTDDMGDRLLRARLEGYAAGVRDGVAGVVSHHPYTKREPH